MTPTKYNVIILDGVLHEMKTQDKGLYAGSLFWK